MIKTHVEHLVGLGWGILEEDAPDIGILLKKGDEQFFLFEHGDHFHFVIIQPLGIMERIEFVGIFKDEFVEGEVTYQNPFGAGASAAITGSFRSVSDLRGMMLSVKDVLMRNADRSHGAIEA